MDDIRNYAKRQAEFEKSTISIVEAIERLCKEYNDAAPPGVKRIIPERHSFFCRCTTCWYKFDGEDRDKRFGDGNWKHLAAQIAEEREYDS